MTNSRKSSSTKARARGAAQSKAAKLLRTPKSSTSSKTVAASALTSSAYERTSTPAARSKAAPMQPRSRKSGSWLLHDAKARFSELIRRVKAEGPQRVTVHGREEVVVVSADDFRRLKGERTGAALIAALQASPSRDVDLAPNRSAMPVRTVAL